MAMQLSPLLPDDLAARPEEGVNIAADDEDPARRYRADLAVTESWQEGVAPSWSPPQDSALEAREIKSARHVRQGWRRLLAASGLVFRTAARVLLLQGEPRAEWRVASVSVRSWSQEAMPA